MTYPYLPDSGYFIDMEDLGLNQRKTIEMLNKLLQAARRAHENGKDRALSKIIDEASRLGSQLNDHMDTRRAPMNAADFYKAYLAEKKPEFVRVEGVVVE